MHTFFFLFQSFGIVGWVFAYGCIMAGVAFAHQRWASSVTQILRLRREQARLRQELALREKALEDRASNEPSAAPETKKPARSRSREQSRPPEEAEESELPRRESARASRPAASTSSSRKAGSVSKSRRQSLREDQQLGLVYYLAPDDPDPLEKLKSLNDDQVQELNMLGIYKFEQIARWTDTNVRSFALLMGMAPEEIEEKGWVEEARILHGRTHGSKMILAA